jgi:hypothetical protein
LTRSAPTARARGAPPGRRGVRPGALARRAAAGWHDATDTGKGLGPCRGVVACGVQPAARGGAGLDEWWWRLAERVADLRLRPH